MSGEIERSWFDRELIVMALPVALLQGCFLLAPLAMTMVLTFQETANYQLQWNWNLATWVDVFSRAYYWTVLQHTLVMGATSVTLCLIIGFPIAYALSTRLQRVNTQIKILLIFTVLTDSTLKIFGWTLFLDKNGALHFLLALVGIEVDIGALLFTNGATMLGMVYNLLPFAIFTIFLSVDAIDRSLILAAYDAGASPFRAFWEVTLPLCRPGIWAGAVLIFLLSVGAFLEPKMLGGGKSPMSAELIRQTFETRVNWPLGAALTLVLMVVSALIVLVFSRVYSIRKAMV